MNKDSFDKALKNKIPDAATDFDLEAAWNSLEARRQRSKRRFIVLWWWLAASLLLGGTAGWWWLQHWPQPAALIIERPQETNTAKPALVPQNTPPPRPNSVEQSPANPAGPDQALAQTYPDKASKTGLATAQHSNKTRQSYSPVAPEKPVEVSKPYEAEERPSAAEMLAPSTAAVDKIENTLSSFEAARQALPPLPLRLHDLQLPLRQPLLAECEFSITQKRRRSKTARWSAGLQASYGLQSVSRSGQETYVQTRQEEEQTLDRVQVGLDVRRQIKGPWFVQAGVQYLQWTDVRQYSAEQQSTRPAPNVLLRQVVYPDGSVENIYGPGEVTVLQHTEARRYNRYRQVEIPLEAGRTFALGKYWGLDLSAGAALGIFAQATGWATIGTTQRALAELPYRKSGTLALQSSVSWMYRTRSWSAGFALLGRADLVSRTQGSLFAENRKGLGLGLVLRHSMR